VGTTLLDLQSMARYCNSLGLARFALSDHQKYLFCDADLRFEPEHAIRQVVEQHHSLNTELDLHSLFGLLCTAVLIG
jgi:hypothetical protein